MTITNSVKITDQIKLTKWCLLNFPFQNTHNFCVEVHFVYFFQSFSLDLLNALNADKAGACDASFLLFFSQADRLIALRAPEDSYLYPHTGEIYQSVKGYYSKVHANSVTVSCPFYPYPDIRFS